MAISCKSTSLIARRMAGYCRAECSADARSAGTMCRPKCDGGIPNIRFRIFDACRSINLSERARAIIESFEPHTHQFIPVDYVNKSGNLLEKRYFFIPCNRIDSMNHDKTTFVFI